jgi:hypothetical protein
MDNVPSDLVEISDLVEALLPFLVILGVVFYGVALARNGNMAAVTVSDREISIEPRGVFKFLSFRWNLRIPVETIAWVSVVDAGAIDPPIFRFGATAFPGLITGTFAGPDGRSYWLTSQRGPALRINLSGGPLMYIVVQVGDPRAVAASIRQMRRA